MPPRMRTIGEAAAELRKIDPGTAVTPYRIRQLVLDGSIPHVRPGTSALLTWILCCTTWKPRPLPSRSYTAKSGP